MRLTEEQYQREVLDKPIEHDKVQLKCFTRVAIVNKDGSFAGDSGFVGPNQVTNDGFNQFLVSALGSIAGSKYISHMGLGTGTVPAAAATTLNGEVGTRTAVTAATSSTSKTLRLTCTFAAGWHTSASAHNIANVGLFNSLSGGTLFAGNTYNSSSCASNQAVNATYDIVFT